MICPRCSKAVAATANFCRHCGTPLGLMGADSPTGANVRRDASPARRYRTLPITLIALGVMLLSGFLVIRITLGYGRFSKLSIPEEEGIYIAVGDLTLALETAAKSAASEKAKPIKMAVGRDLPGSTELRYVVVAPNTFQVIWRSDQLRASSSFRALANWMLLTAERALLHRLSYIEAVFERPLPQDDYRKKEVAAWASGDQIGYGELELIVPLSTAIVSEEPAVLAIRPQQPLEPGLYRFDWAERSLRLFVWLRPPVWRSPGPCVNIWRGNPDLGRPLLKACNAGTTLSAEDASMLEAGRAIRRYLDENFPGWGLGEYGDPTCDHGSPWTPENVWGDFNGDRITDHAVKIYQASVEYLLWFLSDGRRTPIVVERRPLEPEEQPLRHHPYLSVQKAGTGYYDHERGVSGRFPNDAVVRNFCEKSAIAYFYEQGKIRKVWISD